MNEVHFFYTHNVKPEIRIIWSSDNSNSREQKTLTYARNGHSSMLRKAMYLQLYTNFTGELSKHWHCRANSCEYICNPSKFAEIFPKLMGLKLQISYKKEDFGFIFNEQAETTVNAIEQSDVKNSEAELQPEKFLPSLITPFVSFGWSFSLAQPVIIVEGLSLTFGSGEFTETFTVSKDGEISICKRPLNFSDPPLDAKSYLTVFGAKCDQSDFLTAPKPLNNSKNIYQKSFFNSIDICKNKLMKNADIKINFKDSIIKVEKKKNRGRPNLKKQNSEKVHATISPSNQYNPHVFKPAIQGPLPFLL